MGWVGNVENDAVRGVGDGRSLVCGEEPQTTTINFFAELGRLRGWEGLGLLQQDARFVKMGYG